MVRLVGNLVAIKFPGAAKPSFGVASDLVGAFKASRLRGIWCREWSEGGAMDMVSLRVVTTTKAAGAKEKTA